MSTGIVIAHRVCSCTGWFHAAIEALRLHRNRIKSSTANNSGESLCTHGHRQPYSPASCYFSTRQCRQWLSPTFENDPPEEMFHQYSLSGCDSVAFSSVAFVILLVFLLIIVEIHGQVFITLQLTFLSASRLTHSTRSVIDHLHRVSIIVSSGRLKTIIV